MVSLAVSPYEWFTDEVAIVPVILAGLNAGRSKPIVLIVAAAAGMEILAGISPGTGLYTWTVLAWIGWWTLSPKSTDAVSAEGGYSVKAHDSG
jgi:hypothetical protein